MIKAYKGHDGVWRRVKEERSLESIQNEMVSIDETLEWIGEYASRLSDLKYGLKGVCDLAAGRELKHR